MTTRRGNLTSSVPPQDEPQAEEPTPEAEAPATAEEAPAPQEEEPKAAPAKGERYRVLKAITLGDGRTLMPGDEFGMDPAEWPERRAKQLTEQKFVEAVTGH